MSNRQQGNAASPEDVRRIRDRELNASLPYHLRDDVPPLGYCSWCHRKTWGQSELDGNATCRMPQPDGALCPGVIVQWPEGREDFGWH